MGRAFRSLRHLAYGAGHAVRKHGIAALGVIVMLPGLAAAETVTIAALGDSLTQGYGLPQEEGFVPQLQAWLTDQGADVVVQNAGVSGDTTRGGLARVDWTLTGDVDAMIVALGGNDLLRGIDPASSRENLDGILAAAEAKGVETMLVGLSAPGNYGPEFKADFDAMYAELAQSYDALLATNFLGPIQAAVDEGATMGDLMQSDGIHPSAQGVALMVQALGPQVLDLIERARAD
ncbi:arylesterase [Anianabacter salinae]|uniref:arylesterase n=1 Tax=Anianabacter salinae TaxID=2851023 RepID=UPI003899104D|nr:arylesterase [Anianabacter salinae]